MKAKIIRVSIEEADGRLYAESADLPGFFVTEADRASLNIAIADGIRLMYEAEGQSVLVQEAEESDSDAAMPWVAVPFPEGREAAA